MVVRCADMRLKSHDDLVQYLVKISAALAVCGEFGQCFIVWGKFDAVTVVVLHDVIPLCGEVRPVIQ